MDVFGDKRIVIALQQTEEPLYIGGSDIVTESGRTVDVEYETELKWNIKNHLKMGICGEYYAWYLFAKSGIMPYYPLIDDHGIDFIALIQDRVIKIQVKTAHCSNYTFIRADRPKTFEYYYLCYIRVDNGLKAKAYLFSMSDIKRHLEEAVEEKGVKHYENFSYHSYSNSDVDRKPEYGISGADKYYMPCGNIEKYNCISDGWRIRKDNIKRVLKME
ncbi:hypothetical protein [Butyrivibrio sp. AE2032]|uniref:hypothetical protein n=1 Tax=Butyrivibrio sp. AE2032 TaxID=1458463 RepID=UPI00069161E1|nr:hypothetical protein [Butyrivibrio sp. AE2032]